MDDAEISIEFLIEDFELLLVRAKSNSLSIDNEPVIISLCEDLKLLISFLKIIPDALSKPNKNLQLAIQSEENVNFRIPFQASLIEDLKFLKSIIKEAPEETSSTEENNLQVITEPIVAVTPILRKSGNFGTKFIRSFLTKWRDFFSTKHKNLQITNDGSNALYPSSQKNEHLGTLSFKNSRELRVLAKQVVSVRKDIVGAFTSQVGRENSSGGTITSRSIAEVQVLVGFEEEERILLERLTGGMKQLEVISIARVGGDLGTLASSISHHPLIVDHFQVLKDLHSLVTCRNWREMAEEIGNEIHNDLKGKRYLFLFENTGCWDAFKMYFPDDANGSKLIVYSAFPFLNEAKILQHCTARNLAVDEASSALFLSPQLVALAGKVKSIKEEIIHICNNCFNFTMEIPGFRKFSDENLPRESTTPSFREEKVVGFDEEAMALQDKLTGQLKHLEVICIVGMAGIGKTTLAKRLYNDLMMVYHFHIRAWASVSQAYEKGNFLRKLLHFLINDKESLREMSDQDMEVKLYKCLKEKRYLIVVDDIWDIGVWNDIKVCFPDDNNGSKILMTSRIKDVALNVSHRISPLFLRFLSQDESWDLFVNKVFADQRCPQQLTEIGTKLVAKCRGLPLAVVVVAGFLSKKEKTYECWSQVAENIASYFSNDEEEFLDILALSYDYLPHMLKSCFLYLGVFPEDYEIPSRRLIQLWIAEGFIQQTEEKCLEDVADDYLMNLIGRSLVMVGKKRSDGGVKTCCIHDVLRNFCIRKAKENNFLLPNCWYETKASSSPFRPIYFNNYFCSHDDFSLSRFKIYRDNLLSYNFLNVCIPLVAFQKQNMLLYNPLRVLNLGCIFLIRFPFEVLQLVHLKYLVLWIGSMTYLPPVIHILRNLETFILEVERVLTVTLPHDVWKMVKLRHLHISPVFKFEIPWTSEPLLYNLKTVSQLDLSDFSKHLLFRIPNVTKLAFHYILSDKGDHFSFPDLASLHVLETLKVKYQTFGMVPVSIPHPDKFPPSLKKPTLIGSHVSWQEMSIIGSLPKLEVLKIKDNFFSGPRWETCEGGFLHLKFLKLSHLDLQEWIVTADDFPSLERLVLNGCFDLAEIPSAIGDICTLQAIEVYRSSKSAVDSARQIEESQRSWGNDELKLFIYPHFQEDTSF